MKNNTPVDSAGVFRVHKVFPPLRLPFRGRAPISYTDRTLFHQDCAMTLAAPLAQIRFGTGLIPGQPASTVEAMLSDLAAADSVAASFPQDSYETRMAFARDFTRATRARRDSDAADEAFLTIRRQLYDDLTRQLTITLARGVADPSGLRDRLTWFWADHFTTVGKRNIMRGGIAAYVEEAIRPHVAGRFGDMLEAAILHPVMVLYLDQERSYGPNSVSGQRRGADLNENLAREFLELHTVGADGGYSQADVRQMAELLTGLGIGDAGLAFRPNNAEPGPETVMGRSYGGADPAALSEIRAALHDIALRPETARHISAKLADYFVSDTPDPDLLEAMQAAWRVTDGNLHAVMTALMTHPAAQVPGPGRVKRPLHLIASALRALDIPAEGIARAPARRIRRFVERPLAAMGAPWQGATGPDGYFDDDAEWIQPQVLAARIGWCMTTPAALRPRLPDPRIFVQDVLAGAAPPDLSRAAARAESRAEGIGLVFAAPAFQRS